MSKKNRQKRRADVATKTPKKKQIPFVARPFEGLAGEQDLVAMMQILPAATMVVRLNAEHGGGDIRLVTLLPELAQALKRADGEVLVAMQTSMHSGDASRDVAAALLEALELDAGTALTASGLPEPGERLQDILDSKTAPQLDVRETFDFWLDSETAENPEVLRSLEDAFFNAFARVHAARESDLEEGARFVGAFRACGLAIPVWELVPGTEAEELTESMRAMAERLDAALADDAPLDAAARRAKAGIISRQVNL